MASGFTHIAHTIPPTDADGHLGFYRVLLGTTSTEDTAIPVIACPIMILIPDTLWITVIISLLSAASLL